MTMGQVCVDLVCSDNVIGRRNITVGLVGVALSEDNVLGRRTISGGQISRAVIIIWDRLLHRGGVLFEASLIQREIEAEQKTRM